jgi:site-specific recombinase XerD
MDARGWEELQPWLKGRLALPVGPLSASAMAPPAAEHGRARPARAALRRTAAAAGVRRRFAPHPVRHTHAVEMPHGGVPLIVIPRQPGNLGLTPVYIHGIETPRSLRPSTHAARR